MNQAQGTQQKGSNSGLIIVIIILVVIVVLGVGGYFAWKSYGSKLFGTKASPSSSLSVSPSPTTSVSPSATPAASPSFSTSKVISGDYVISDSDTRVIKEAEIRDFTPWQLKVARNEIYARHGRPFVHKDLQCYFATKSWYKVDESFTESSLSVIENKNIATIKDFEEKINSPMLAKDTGC